MDPSDSSLHALLLDQLREAGEVQYNPATGVLSLRELPYQRAPLLRLRLTPTMLGRAADELAPEYAEVFPLLEPREAALVVIFVRILCAIERAGTTTRDITVSSDPGEPSDRPRKPRRRRGTRATMGRARRR